MRVSEHACPFCTAPLDFSDVPAQLLPTERLSRSKMVSFRTLVGAGVLGATAAVAGCDDVGQAQAIYGAPCMPPDCGPVGGSAGGGGTSFAGSGAATSGGGGSGGRSDTGGESGAGGEGGS